MLSILLPCVKTKSVENEITKHCVKLNKMAGFKEWHFSYMVFVMNHFEPPTLSLSDSCNIAEHRGHFRGFINFNASLET